MSSYIDSIGQAMTASNSSGSAPVEGEKNSMGKEDFLTLLVAQLQNQDPLNPDDPTEFTAQLAQFSSLEQLFTLNESMNNMVASNAASDRLSTLGTIGKEVAYHGDTFKYSGEPVEIGYQLDGTAADLTLSLQYNGTAIAALKGTDLSEGRHFITWDGLTTDGEKAPVGDYQIVVSAVAIDGESVGVAPLVKSEVTGVDMNEESGGTLITQSGSIGFDKILGVYEPDSRIKTSAQVEEDNETVIDSIDTVAALTENVAEIVE